MCLAKAYLNTQGDRPVLQDVARLRIQGEQVEMQTSKGETKVILGKVVEVDFLKSSVSLDVIIHELNIV